MAKFLEKKIVRFTELNDLNGDPIFDYKDYLNLEGLLVIMKTERICRKHSGEYYLSFYPNEPGEEQRHFDTPVGDIIDEGNRIILNAGQQYVFICGNDLSDEDVERISSEFFFGIQSMIL